MNPQEEGREEGRRREGEGGGEGGGEGRRRKEEEKEEEKEREEKEEEEEEKEKKKDEEEEEEKGEEEEEKGEESYVGNLVHQNLIHLSNIYLRGFSLYSQKFAPHQQWFATGPRPVEHLSQESPNFYLLTEGKNKATLTFSFARAGCARSISAGNLRTKGSPQKS